MDEIAGFENNPNFTMDTNEAVNALQEARILALS